MSDFLTLARERYSCRSFSAKPVEAEKLEAVLQAAILAPTAVNRQPWHAWAITSPEAVAKVHERTRFHFDANAYVMVGAKADEAWTRKYDGRNFADVDASIVATHVMLAAHDVGLGTTWVGHFNAPAMKEAFPEMEEYDLVALFPLGYPADDAKPADGHYVRKSADELVSYL